MSAGAATAWPPVRDKDTSRAAARPPVSVRTCMIDLLVGEGAVVLMTLLHLAPMETEVNPSIRSGTRDVSVRRVAGVSARWRRPPDARAGRPRPDVGGGDAGAVPGRTAQRIRPASVERRPRHRHLCPLPRVQAKAVRRVVTAWWIAASAGLGHGGALEHHEVVDDALVADRGDRDTGLPERVGVHLALVAQYIGLAGDDQRRRQRFPARGGAPGTAAASGRSATTTRGRRPVAIAGCRAAHRAPTAEETGHLSNHAPGMY